jgi:hypothetical protein
MVEAGKILMAAGVLFVVIGAALVFSDKIPFLGRLPGDIVIRKESSTFYFPLATSLLISAIISLLMWLFRK